jgi:hypothetical protein
MFFERDEVVDDESETDPIRESGELEREIEREFGILLTHDCGGPQPDGRPADLVRWSHIELLDLREVLRRLPSGVLVTGPGRLEFRRSRTNYYRRGDGAWVQKNDAGAYRSGVVRIFDASIGDRQDHAGDTSELAGFGAANPIQAMQQTLAHELGHAVEGSEGAARFHAAVGWREGVAERLRETRRKGVAVDRRVYLEVGDQVWSYVKGQLPEGGAHSGGTDPDTWDYARSQPREYFAECYSKAILVPELLYEDLVGAPARRVDDARARLAAAPTPGERGRLAAALVEAVEDREAMARQWTTLREEVFHLTDADIERSVAELAARAEARRVDRPRRDDVVAELRAKAARAMTREQIERLQARCLEG